MEVEYTAGCQGLGGEGSVKLFLSGYKLVVVSQGE